MPDAALISYVPRRVALPDKPRKVNVSITRTADGLWHTSMPAEDLDYLIAAEYQRQRQLEDIAAHNDEDAAEIAKHGLFVEHGIEGLSAAKPFRNGKPKPKPKPKTKN